jgi:hypothetical protein
LGGVTERMSELTSEETLIVRVAISTCFLFSVDEVPNEDVDLYVGELLRLYRLKPDAQTRAAPALPQDLKATLEFCADRLDVGAPEQAARIRAALKSCS